MDYRIAYDRFIQAAKSRMQEVGSKQKLFAIQNAERLEVHHVNPKQMGGNNKLKNLVLLSHNEHVYAHLLLNLALAQQHRYNELAQLSYTNMPSGVLNMVKARKSIFRSLKIDMFIAGKKWPPTTMSIIDAAKILCVLARLNFSNELMLKDMAAKALRLALFRKSIFGYKLCLHI